MARPTKLTKDLTKRICQLIRAGNYPGVAARAAGISESTYYRWKAEGASATKGIHRDFYEAVDRAEAESEARAVAIVAKAMEGDWRAAIALLERRHGERWRRRERTDAPFEERPALDLKDLSAKELKNLEGLIARTSKPD